MKKSTVWVTIILILIVVGLVGTYAFLIGNTKARADDAVMTPVQTALNRDLSKDYPATVKEVVKYYTEIEKCLFNEKCTEEELEQLGMQARRLYDEELLSKSDNQTESYLDRLKTEVKTFQKKGRKYAIISVAGSTSVDTFSEDGYEFARIHCGYTMTEKGQSWTEGRVFLLRRDEQRRWKIYGFDAAQNVNPK